MSQTFVIGQISPPEVTGCAGDEYLHRSYHLSLSEQTSFGW